MGYSNIYTDIYDGATPFPQQILGMAVELLVNGVWTDISSYVYQRDNIVITRGRQDETSTAQPSQMTLTLNNIDGRFSPRNTSGAYYPYIGRNTQLRLSTQLTAFADSTTYQFRFWGEVSAWPPVWDPTGADVYVPITASGILRRFAQGAPIGSPLYRYYTNLTGSLAPAAYWPCEDQTGATSINDAVDDNDMVITGTATLASDAGFPGSDPIPLLSLSSWDGLTPDYSTSGDNIYTTPGTYTWKAPGGVTTADTRCWGAGAAGHQDPANDGGGAGEFAREAANTVVPGSGYTIVVGAPGTDKSGQLAGGDSTFSGPSATTVVAHGAGGLHNYLGGTGSTNSVHHNGGTGGRGSGSGGGGGAGSGGLSAAGNNGGTPSGQNGGAGAAAVTDGGPGAAGGHSQKSGQSPSTGPGGGGGGAGADLLPSDNTKGGNGQAGRVEVIYSASTTPNNVVLRFLLHLPSAGTTDGNVLVRLLSVGTVAQMDVIYRTGGNLQLKGIDSLSVTKFDSGSVSFGANGKLMMVSAELAQSGTSVGWTLTAITPAGVVTGPFTGSFTGTLGSVTEIITNPAQTVDDTALGHITVQYDLADISTMAKVINGYRGETAATRLARLCSEENIPFTIVGRGNDTVVMGQQANDTLPNVLQACEDVDRGFLYEPRGSFGLAYRTLIDLQSQSPTATLDYSAGDLAQGIQPTEDDQQTRNDVTVTRDGGSAARKFLASGPLSIQAPPNGVGSYSYALTVFCSQDTQLSGIAGWILNLGTYDDLRYPSIPIDLTRSEVQSLFQAITSLDVGDYLQITNPPAWLPNGPLKQLTVGFTETISAKTFTIAANCIPELPFETTPLFTNGDFETNTTGWTGQNGATLTQSTTFAVTGTHSARIAPDGTTASPQIQSSRVTCVPGALCTFYGWLSSAISQSAKVSLHFYDGTATHITTADISAQVTVPAGPKPIGVSGFAPSNAATVAVLIAIPGTPLATSYLYADNLVGYTCNNVSS